MHELRRYLTSQTAHMQRQYVRALNRDLAKQQYQQLFGRNVVAVLDGLLTDLRKQGCLHNSTALDVKIALAYHLDKFVEAAVKHNQSSCAISNFPDEHHPSSQYISDVIQQCETLCDEFASVQGGQARG